jgi:hypothetical protein
LLVDSTTVIETDAAAKAGPRLRIGDGRDAVVISLPLGADAAITFCVRLERAVAGLAAAVTEHGTAYPPPDHAPAR